jgi:sulfopyruvate decarboxylase alpha subunit
VSVVEPNWSRAVYERLVAADVRQVALVPDTAQRHLIDHCRRERGWTTVTLTTEEEGVALLAGAWLGGQRGALLMQSSGLGNCFNMLGLTLACRFPLMMIVTLRGEWGEFNPWMVPLGRVAQDLLERIGVTCMRVDRADEAGPTIDAAARMAFEGPHAVAVLLTQKLVGARTLGQ